MSSTTSTPKIYKSSAGSGKTFTLVKEYLTVVLRQPEQYRHILAITFTNKAAGEMKERIVGELKEMSTGVASTMRDLIKEITGLPDKTLSDNARRTLGFILHDYANFGVSTIDAFTYRIIRNFARDLDLPSKFDVETDTKALTQRMVDQLMDAIGRDEYITRILVHFAEEKLREEGGWKIDANINAVAMELFKEGSSAPLKTLQSLEPDEFIGFIEFMKEEKDNYPAEMARLGAQALDLIKAAGLGIDDFKGKSRGGIATVFVKIQNKLSPGDYQKLLTSGRFAKALEDDRWASAKGGEEAIQALLSSGLRVHIDALLDYHANFFDSFMTAFHAYQNIHSLAVLRQIEELLDVYKEQHNLVHISEFQGKISDVIQAEETEYIYWRLGERYQHYLLDEFQDTSVLQWLNLAPLFDNIIAGSQNGSLLLVGDSKQAIYRWRGGEIDLMEHIAPDKLGVDPLVLGRNFRSLEYVVDFNNRFFGTVKNILAPNEMVGQIYTDFEQAIRPGNEGGGLAQIALLEGKTKSAFQEVALERLLEQIRTLTSQGFSLQDMAILIRTTGEGSTIAQYLNEHGIRVISSESLLLRNAPVIGFIVSLFKFLVSPIDRIAQAEILHYYYSYLDGGEAPDMEDGDLNALESFFDQVQPATQSRVVLKDEKSISKIFEVFPDDFKRLSYQLDRLPLYELTERIIQIFDLRHRSPAYLQHFLDMVLQYAERRKPDLTGFLEHWEEQKNRSSVVVPEGEDAVEILTVHKSKGLEFPVVFVPFCNWDMAPRFTHTFWAKARETFEEYPNTYLIAPKKELAESRFQEDYLAELERTMLDNVNLLYVAFTRPRERLYIYSPVWDRSRKKAAPTIEDITNVGRLINLVMEEPGFDEAGNLSYETGIPEPPREVPTPSDAVAATELLSESWRDRIRIERRFRKYWEGNGGPKATLPEGTLMADALRRLLETDELPLVLNRMQEEGLVIEPQKTELSHRIDALMQLAPFDVWFAQGASVRRSREVILPTGEAYRPDRLLLEDKAATAINFVDAEKESADASDLEAYLEALTEMGFGPIKGYIVYLPMGNVELVVEG